MSVEVLVGNNNEWDFQEPEPTPSHDITPAEWLTPDQQWRARFAEELHCLNAQIIAAQDYHDRRVSEQRGSGQTGYSFDDGRLWEARIPLNRLQTERRRILLAGRLHYLSKELSDTQNRYDQCIEQRLAACALGSPLDDNELHATREQLNDLTPQRLDCIASLEEVNQSLHYQGTDSYQLASRLARLGYENSALPPFINPDEDLPSEEEALSLAALFEQAQSLSLGGQLIAE